MFDEQNALKEARLFDRQALASIYDEYSPELYRYAMRLLGNSDIAEDCVSETFSRFLKALRTKRGPKQYLKPYLYRIAHNWIVDHYRQKKEMVELKDTHASTDPMPEQEAGLRMRQAQVQAAIQKLTPDQQQVIALKFLEDWKNEDIAKVLKKPVGAIKSLQHRALVQLKKHLSESNPYEEPEL